MISTDGCDLEVDGFLSGGESEVNSWSSSVSIWALRTVSDGLGAVDSFSRVIVWNSSIIHFLGNNESESFGRLVWVGKRRCRKCIGVSELIKMIWEGFRRLEEQWGESGGCIISLFCIGEVGGVESQVCQKLMGGEDYRSH